MTRGRPCSRLCSLPAACLLACAAQPQLPPPSRPLVLTADAPFRARPPALEPLAEADQAAPPRVEAATLDNGLTLWVVHKSELPYVALSFVAREAGTFDARVPAELVQLTTRAIVEGGTIWTDGSTVDPPAVNGARVAFGAFDTHSAFSLEVLRGALGSGVEVLARTLRFPAFHAGSWDLVRLAEAEAVRGASSLSSLLLKVTVAGMFDEEVSLHAAPMRLEPLKSAALEDVRQHYRELMNPASSALIAVGDVTLAELRERAELAFGGWRSERAPRVVSPRMSLAPPSPGRVVHLFGTGDRPQAQVLIAQPAPASSAREDELAFALLAELSIGAIRSRANNALRHGAGLTYGVHPRFVTGRAASLLIVEAAFESDDAPRAIEDLLAMFTDLQARPVGEEELERAKRALHGRVVRGQGDNLVLASQLAHAFAAGRTPEWLHSFRERLAAVRAADLQRVAEQYLRPGDAQIGVYGSARLRPRLGRIGAVKNYSVRQEGALF